MIERWLKRLGLLHPEDPEARNARLERVKELEEATEEIRSGRTKISVFVTTEAEREADIVRKRRQQRGHQPR